MKRILASFLAVVLAVSGLSVASVTAGAANLVSGDFEYSVSADNSVCIEKYNGEATTLIIPSSIAGRDVTKLAYRSFANNKTLTWICIPNTVKACGGEVFFNTRINTATFGDSADTVPSGLFKNANMLEKVVLPSSLKYIEEEAFENCISLSDIYLPFYVKMIDNRAFAGCTSLKSLMIPNTMTIGGTSVFEDSGLESVEYRSDSAYVTGGFFKNAKNLKNVTLPYTIKSIGASAFEGCTALERINLPDELTILSDRAFADCTALTSITIPWKVTRGGSAFSGSGIKKATFISGATVVPESLFRNATNLTQVVLPDTITEIKNSAFEGCTSLSGVTLPSSLEVLGNRAFAGCTALTSIKIPKSLKSGSNAFSTSGLKTAIIEDGATAVLDSLFNDAEYLTEVTIPNTVKSIGEYAFNFCVRLEGVTLPDGLTEIGKCAFRNCDSMKSITIPKTVTSMGEKAVGYEYSSVVYGFVINGYENTTAQTYAINNKITFNAIKEEPVLVGDTDNDGKIDVSDVTYLQMYLAGESTSIDISNTADFKRADANDDGKVDVSDVTEIQNLIAS